MTLVYMLIHAIKNFSHKGMVIVQAITMNLVY